MCNSDTTAHERTLAGRFLRSRDTSPFHLSSDYGGRFVGRHALENRSHVSRGQFGSMEDRRSSSRLHANRQSRRGSLPRHWRRRDRTPGHPPWADALADATVAGGADPSGGGLSPCVAEGEFAPLQREDWSGRGHLNVLQGRSRLWIHAEEAARLRAWAGRCKGAGVQSKDRLHL